MSGRRLGQVIASLLVVGLVVAVWAGVSAGTAKPWQVVFAPITVVYLFVGQRIAERRPGNVVGPIVFTFGVAIAAYLIADVYVRASGQPPGTPFIAWAVNHMEPPFFVLIGSLFLTFPDGRLPSARWRWVLLAMLIVAAVAAVGLAFVPGPLSYYPEIENPFGIDGLPGTTLAGPAYVLLVLSVAASAGALVVRWRRGDRVERAQLKWVATAAALVGATMTAYAVLYGPGAYSDVMDTLLGLAFACFPVAIGIAILRYRLYDIDRLISRGLAWTVVTATLAAVVAGSILALQTLLGDVTQGETFAVAASTLFAAALFQPLRRRVQDAVDRRFDRTRVDATQAVERFAAHVRDEVDLGTLRRLLTDAAEGAVQPAATSLWIRGLP